MLVAALSILLALLLMEALKPVPAIVGAKLIALWTVVCTSIVLYYTTSPTKVGIPPFLGNQD
jgi:hypothetical protein